MMTRVLVIGAGGKLGRRLVASGLAQGHEVTAFVRSRERLTDVIGEVAERRLRVIEADATDEWALAEAMAVHGHTVSAAGNVADGDVFTALFAHVLAAAERALAPPRRLWMLAGAAILNVPHTQRIGVGLPGVPELYRPHEANWRAIEASTLDWSLMCPGPMETGAPKQLADIMTSVNEMPIPVGRWTAWAPAPALSMLLLTRRKNLIVGYEAVADVIMSNLDPGRFSRRRVGIVVPNGIAGFARR